MGNLNYCANNNWLTTAGCLRNPVPRPFGIYILDPPAPRDPAAPRPRPLIMPRKARAPLWMPLWKWLDMKLTTVQQHDLKKMKNKLGEKVDVVIQIQSLQFACENEGWGWNCKFIHPWENASSEIIIVFFLLLLLKQIICEHHLSLSIQVRTIINNICCNHVIEQKGKFVWQIRHKYKNVCFRHNSYSHILILPCTGQENNIAQPKIGKLFSFLSHFSPYHKQQCILDC